MHSLILILAVVAQTNEPSRTAYQTPREVHLIRKEVSELLKSESATEDEPARAAKVRRMTEVYGEILSDPRLVDHPVLQQQKIKLWTRMTRVRDEIRRKLKIEARHNDGPSDNEQIASSLASHLELASQTLGGSSLAFAHSASGGGPIVDDFGDELIDLITRTIEPDHWKQNGGPATIFYYRPLMALVVRARSEVHESLGGVLSGLRK